MSRHLEGPRAGSRAHIALGALHSIGGQAVASVWMRAVRWARMVTPRDWDIIVQNLINARMVYQRGDIYMMSDDGLEWLGIPVDAPPVEVRPVAGPRYSPGIRPLAQERITRMPLTREGALDYRDIPSRVGDQLIAYGSKA